MLKPLSRATLAASLFVPALATAQDIRLVHGSFDPTIGFQGLSQILRGDATTNLYIVQFEGRPTEEGRAAVRALGAEIHGYLPDNAYVVRMDANAAKLVRGLEAVRAASFYHPEFRLEPFLRTALREGATLAKAKYNVVAVDKHTDKPALIQKVRALGGTVTHEQTGSILIEVELTGKQVQQVARLDETLWIDRWTPTDTDMDNARIQGGGNYVESQGGYTGSGVNAHIYEGIEATHQDFNSPVTVVRSANTADNHGHATAGIVFGDGTSNPAVRGMAPDAGKFFTNNGSVSGSRWQVVSDLINIHNVSHTTASWGNARTRAYTSISADADDIIFDHDMAWTQSQSNAGNQDSRPQAWAKNIFSIGGVAHGNNSNPGDDSWAGGGGSTGPAADGRIKPTLCAYYDQIGTSDRTGSAGYSAANWTSGFGGTSGATPIVAGHNVLAIQMFTDGVFGNTLRNPGGSRHSNRPKFTTLKALQIVSAAQYSFNAGSSDNRREHQGWGFPDLRKMYDNRAKTFIVDETDVLTQGTASRWDITVGAGEPELKIAMSYSDPAANPSANPTRINDLSIRVTAPDGTSYWGNNGLEQGVWSTSGGTEDNINTVESVFVQNPQAGVWNVDVVATLVVQDSHVETPAVDADYGLVVSGGTGVPGVPPIFGKFEVFGQGCPGSVQLPPTCAAVNPNGGTLAGTTRTNEYAYFVQGSGTQQVVSFDIFTTSTAGTIVAPAFIYAEQAGAPAASPIGTTTLTVNGTPGFYTATFASPVTVTGNFFIAIDHAPGNGAIVLSTLTGGSSGFAFWQRPGVSWSQSGLITAPSYRVTCVGSGGFATAEIAANGTPAIDRSFDVNLSNAAPNAVALAVLGDSDATFNGQPLPAPIPGAPGCNLLIAPTTYQLVLTDGSGNASNTLNVPNNPSLVGLEAFHQWVIADGVNALGVTTSNAGKTTIGN